MTLKKMATAGTLESSDAMVTVEPGENGVELELSSTVIHQFGRQIRELVYDVLQRLEVDNCVISVVDHGALDCTLKARIEAAVFRAAEESGNIPWGGSVK